MDTWIGRPAISRRLLAILGKRAFFSFGLVTFLVAALLSAVNITSRYALKLYVEDQLYRTPWDLAVYDESGGSSPTIADRLLSLDGVKQLKRLVFLRAAFPQDVSMVINGKLLTTPWLCLLTASDLNLLPPALHLALGQGGMVKSSNGQEAEGALLALVGPESATGSAFSSLQGAQDFSLQVNVQNKPRVLFSTPVRGVIRLEADQLNRWFMDQTGSLTMIPHTATILLMPFRGDVVSRFDAVAMAHVSPEELGFGGEANEGDIKGKDAEYLPEKIYLLRVDRRSLVSGWDLNGSLKRFTALRDQVRDAMRAVGSEAVVDSTVLVLLQRMNEIAKLIGALTLLIALPLLWMAWVLAANLCRLLVLNERRTLGLMRLRGVPGNLLGRAFLLAITAGGILGGILGLLVGSVAPLIIYGRGHLPRNILLEHSQIYLSTLFLIITVSMALLIGRRLIRYVTRISPLEASGRVAISESSHAEVRFGPLELLSLVLGTYTLGGWIFDISLSSKWPHGFFPIADRTLGFVGFPLYIYGITCLLVSQGSWTRKLLGPMVRPLGGRLGSFALRYISIKPYRTASSLLIVTLMVSICLYPTVAGPSFRDKAVRGVRVETGAQWQFTFNAPDLVQGKQISKNLGLQLERLHPGIQEITSRLKDIPEISSVAVMSEAILPNFYVPGHGFSGIPLFLISDPGSFLRIAYSEPELGIGDPFEDILLSIRSGDIGLSPPVAEFWGLSRGARVPLGKDEQSKVIAATVGGVFAFLPGMPPRTVTDREGYVQARIGYLNYLFKMDSYLVASADNAALADLRVQVPRVIVLVKVAPGLSSGLLGSRMLRALPEAPLEVHNLDEEIQKVGSDMFVYLALANMKFYLLFGFLLALVSILAIALVNFAEDRHTLGLMRIRGASPEHIRQFLVAVIISPALLGVILGGMVALLAGYGLSVYLWRLRDIKTFVQALSTHLVISSLTVGAAIAIPVVLIGVIFSFSSWIFDRTARESIREG